MRGGKVKSYAGVFQAGLNTEAGVYNLADGEARSLRNVISTTRGSLKKRPGVQTFATAGTTLTSLFAAQSPTFLIGAGGTVLYSIAPNGTVTTIKTAMTNAAKWDFIQAPAKAGQGPIYGSNGTDIQQWDGAAATTSAWTAATGTLPTGAKYLTYAGNRVWAAGMASYGSVADPASTVVSSNLADPRDWPVANVFQFSPGDGEAISGMAKVGPYVLVFKPSKAWVIYDLDSGANRPLGEGVGCVSHRSICEGPAGAYFLARDGIYVTDGSTVKRISDRIRPTIDSVLPANRSLAAGTYFGGHYYLSISDSGTANTLTVDYDSALDSFWLHSNAETEFAVWEATSGVPALYGAHAGSGVLDKLYVSGELQDNAAAFSAWWYSPFYTWGDLIRRKRVRLIHFDGAGRIQVAAAKTFARGGAELADVSFATSDGLYGTNDGTLFAGGDSSLYGGLVDVSEARIPTPGVARAWSVLIGNTTAETFEVDSFSFAFDSRRN